MRRPVPYIWLHVRTDEDIAEDGDRLRIVRVSLDDKYRSRPLRVWMHSMESPSKETRNCVSIDLKSGAVIPAVSRTPRGTTMSIAIQYYLTRSSVTSGSSFIGPALLVLTMGLRSDHYLSSVYYNDKNGVVWPAVYSTHTVRQ